MRILIFLFLPFFADAQIVRAWPFYTAPEEAAVVTNLLLDSFSGAAVAYSLRKLDKDYTGSAVRVRRKSDNTESDIGFSGNYLDTAALKTFAGTGATDTAWVVTWYNQADSSGVFGVRNATNATAINQPLILRSGQIIYEGGDIAILFSAVANAQDFLDVAGGATQFTGTDKFVFAFAAQKSIANSSQQALFGFGNTSNTIPLRWGGASDASNNYRLQERDDATVITTTSGGTATNYTLMAVKSNMDNGELWSDGVSVFTKTMNAGATTLNNLCIGCLRRTSREAYYNGSMIEVVIYPSDQSSNRTAIESNINAFYSIY